MSSLALRAALLGLALTGCRTRLEPQVLTVNGHAVELATSGAGSTTVVFESGLGADWSVWDEVAAEVAKTSRVFVYSRPGYGKSGPATTPRDATHIAEELRALLADQGYSPPYVLVGHSFGGGYLELFAKAHPDEVSALVLVDPRHRDFTAECEARGISGCGIPAAALRVMPRVEQDEVAAYAGVSSELRAAGAFGPYPVRVLTATAHAQSKEWKALWRSLLASLADEAADGEQIVFEGAGHGLHQERAQEVARVIVEQVRARE